jgi:hypothetical protein
VLRIALVRERADLVETLRSVEMDGS